MAWISVHDHVDGKKLRRLSKMLDCSKAEALGVLNFLWFWGLNNADENGRIEDADKGDVAEVFYGKTEIPPEKVVSALFSSGWLDDVGGIIYLHDWSEWQEQWYKFRRKRDYDARRKRDERAKNRRDPQEGQQPVKRKKPKRETVRMAEFVHLTEAEYQKLCTEYGKQAADLMVKELDLYKGSKGKAYKDDYRAILSWVVDRVEKKYPGVIVRRPSTEGNPFKEYEGGDA